METKLVVKSGLSFSSLLTLIFIVLKLCSIISWSWFWVLSPLLFGLALDILVIIVMIIVSLFE